MVVIGVTGTKGKSSTVFLLAKILEGAGMHVAVSSSLMFKIKDNEWLNPHHMTMAGRFKLQEFLYQAKAAGCTHVIIETTSQGIAQFRHKFINFDVAVFTNLSPEHIEAHGGFENYKRAKGKLFEAIERLPKKNISGAPIEKAIVLNMDDENIGYYMQFHADRQYGFGLKAVCALPDNGHSACFFTSAATATADGIQFTVENIFFTMKLLGTHNIYNALCAAVTAKSLGVGFQASQAALKNIEDAVQHAQAMNANKQNIYMCINPIDPIIEIPAGQAAKDTDILAAFYCFADADTAGAMENWGLVTYREELLLVDKKSSSLMTKQYVAIVIAHELAHFEQFSEYSFFKLYYEMFIFYLSRIFPNIRKSYV